MINDLKDKISLSSDLTAIILESISDGVFTVDHEWCITSFNKAAEKITGISRKEAIGKRCCEVFRSNMCESDCALRRTMEQGIPFVDTATYIINSKQQSIPVTVCTALLQDASGKILGGVETFRDMSLVEELRRALDAKYQLGDIISRSHSMEKIMRLLPKIAESDSTVLIQGETGTGKELIARAIHDLGPRREKPFIAVNCGALPDTLLESELFGYKAGAFTNAVKDKPGLFAAAEGGTILLDEIGDVSPAFQVRMLRVLQERTYMPLGAVKPEKTDVRVITASNKDVQSLVDSGVFRKDLYYRINVLKIQLPALKDRKNDIPMLAEHFIDKFNTLKNRDITGISADAMDMLMSHSYPGNIRELENLIEHAFILCPDHTPIESKHLPETLKTSKKDTPSASIRDRMHSLESETILDALERNHHNRLATARELNIHKSTLFRKMKKLGIEFPKTDGRSRLL